MIRIFLVISFMFVCVCSGAAAAKPIVGTENPLAIREKRSIGKEQFKEAFIFIFPQSTDTSLMRSPVLDVLTSSIQQGLFPSNDSSPQTHGLPVELFIDESGLLTTCNILQAAETVSINSHVCPHLTKFAKFHPALESDS